MKPRRQERQPRTRTAREIDAPASATAIPAPTRRRATCGLDGLRQKTGQQSLTGRATNIASTPTQDGYQSRTGCEWTCLPHDLPPKSATYYYFATTWRDDGTDQAIHELLRCQVRERARRLGRV